MSHRVRWRGIATALGFTRRFVRRSTLDPATLWIAKVLIFGELKDRGSKPWVKYGK